MTPGLFTVDTEAELHSQQSPLAKLLTEEKRDRHNPKKWGTSLYRWLQSDIENSCHNINPHVQPQVLEAAKNFFSHECCTCVWEIGFKVQKIFFSDLKYIHL